MKPSDAQKKLTHVTSTLIIFLCLLCLFIGLSIGQTVLRDNHVNWTDWITAAATVALVIFAYYTWRGANETHELQKQMVNLQDRFVWLIGAMESHTDQITKFLARQHGIPVIWWDPKTQEWPRKPKHGDVFKGEAMLSFLPVDLRGRPENKPIDVDALLRQLNSSKRVRKYKKQLKGD